MFDPFALNNAREQCIAIARERLAVGLNGINKEGALSLVVGALEHWRSEQAAPDGTITITLEPLALGVPGTSLRLPLAEVSPWQCAGPGFKCDADLFARLVFGEKYPQAVDVEAALGPGVAVALLLERDGQRMPVDSLAYAVRHIWLYTFYTLQAFRDELVKVAGQIRERATKNATLAAKRSETAKYAHAEWRATAANIWRGDITLKGDGVAAMICDALPDAPKGKKKPSRRTIRDAIKTVQGIVKVELQRARKRKLPA